MKDKLIALLEQFCPDNVYLQGTIEENELYPDEFITFFVDSTADNSHYDDDVNSVDWYISVLYYSTDPALVNSKPAEIQNALKKAGFIPQGKGHDLASDVKTHTGWALDFTYIEYL